MKRHTTFALAVAAVATVAALSSCQSVTSNRAGNAASSTSAAASTAAAHTWTMKKVDVTTQVNDLQRQGASLQVHGLSMLVPKDWSFQGQATIPPKQDCAMTMGRFNLQTQSPDKTSGLEVLAQTTSFWSSNPAALQQVKQQNQQPYSAINCQVAQPATVAEALPKAVSQFIQDAQPVGAVQPVPGMSDRLAAETAQANQQMTGGARLTADAGRLRVNGTIGGKPVEAWVVALHTVRFTNAPGGGTNQLSDIPLFAVMYTPRGQLDGQEAMFSAMLDSINIDPQWTSYMAQFVAQLVGIRQRAMNQVSQIYANMAADNARAAAQQQQIRNGVAAYRGQVYASVASNRAAALDHSSQQFALHMGDQAIYSDPSTGQKVQMSNQYGHAWASTTGNSNQYILTDSASFNPNGQVGSGSWTQLQEEH